MWPYRGLKFTDHRDHVFFLHHTLQRTWFFHIFGVLSCKNNTKSKVFALKLETRRRFASRHFLALIKNFIVQLCCVQILVGRLLLSHENNSEGTLCSVPIWRLCCHFSWRHHIAKNHVNSKIFYQFCDNCKIPSFSYHLKDAEMKITYICPFLRVSQKS